MSSKSIDATLCALREGEISFASAVQATRKTWRGLAERLFYRWTLPSSIAIEDVEQELHLAMWEHVGKWDPKRGVGIGRYVIFNAMARAAKILHRERRAKGRKGPSRHPILLGEDELIEYLGSIDPEQEQAAIRESELRALVRAQPTEGEAALVVAIYQANGQIEKAADRLVGDFWALRATGATTRANLEWKLRHKAIEILSARVA